MRRKPKLRVGMTERELFEGAMTEIGAGRVLVPKDELERTWNAACERALSIVRRYRDGEGLFQIAAKREVGPRGAQKTGRR